MTRKYIILVLFCSVFHISWAGDYLPLVREGVKWVYSDTYTGAMGDPESSSFEVNRCYSIELKGDTIIDGKTYKKAFRTSEVDLNKWLQSHAIATSEEYPIAYLRESRKIVWAVNNTNFPIEAIAEMYLGDDFYGSYYSGQEYALYSFQEDEQMEIVGTVTICGAARNVYNWDGNSDPIVESVGYDGMLGDLLTPFKRGMAGYGYSNNRLHHVEDADGNVIYKGSAYYANDAVRGDFDGNSVIDIDDLNACINRLLAPQSVDVTHDVTADGVVDIDDVNAVINKILHK